MGSLIRRWRLLLLLLGAAGLLWLNLSSTTPGVVPAAERALSIPTSSGASAMDQTNQAVAALPEQLSRPLLEPSSRDPFVPDAPKPLPVAIAKPPLLAMPVPVTVTTPPPAPEPPSLNMIYAGRMVEPDGGVVVYVTVGDSNVALKKGQDLPSGYRVTAITERAVEFSYPALNRTQRLDLPPPQKYETR